MSGQLFQVAFFLFIFKKWWSGTSMTTVAKKLAINTSPPMAALTSTNSSWTQHQGNSFTQVGRMEIRIWVLRHACCIWLYYVDYVPFLYNKLPWARDFRLCLSNMALYGFACLSAKLILLPHNCATAILPCGLCYSLKALTTGVKGTLALDE